MEEKGKSSLIVGTAGMGKTRFGLGLLKEEMLKGKTVAWKNEEVGSVFLGENNIENITLFQGDKSVDEVVNELIEQEFEMVLWDSVHGRELTDEQREKMCEHGIEIIETNQINRTGSDDLSGVKSMGYERVYLLSKDVKGDLVINELADEGDSLIHQSSKKYDKSAMKDIDFS